MLIRLTAAVVLLTAMAGCEPTAPAKGQQPQTVASSKRWQITPRGEDELATVRNANGYTLALGCAGIGESGRYMEVLRGTELQGDPPEYAFSVATDGRVSHQGAVDILSVGQNTGGTVSYAALSIDSVDAIRKGNSVEVRVPGQGSQTFGLSGSLAAIDATAC